jgi:cell division GTPase FtsZ
VITIPNERILSIIDRQTSLTDAFSLADDVLRQAIQGISDLILVPGLINLDFADVKTIMSGMGVAMMGTGIAEGEHRAMQAAQKAVASPLLEDGSVNGARGVIINVTGGPDLSLMEVNEASSVIQEAAHEDANIIFGAVVDPNLTGRIKITVIATGFDRKAGHSTVPTPVELNAYTDHLQARMASAAASEPAVREGVAPSIEVPPQPQVGRRGLDARSTGSTTGGDRAVAPGMGVGLDMGSLDTPAFLRRQN